jgi:hypothetical protein
MTCVDAPTWPNWKQCPGLGPGLREHARIPEQESRPLAGVSSYGRRSILVVPSWSNLMDALEGHQAVSMPLKALKTLIRGRRSGAERGLA